ncbi:MAG: tRNA (adenosine(37)-N6)-threonylcarbamoyltransferase complex transferase subunit TsaD [Rickettsiales bacterium]|jgi:N6-L-threonylcarbamoyladenine synthase|nr:tRNA (adenosine(37)-N6)-threonylcarbamoyltransferase complex transferase subunit TsaD [Rickettsiales bacterium]
MMLILGMETSCDETAMAVIDENKNILSHVVFSQIDIHKEFGGVVPEIAARNHVSVIDKVLELTLKKASVTVDDVDAIGVTTGPGLIGGVLVGALFAKTIASIKKKPLIAVNHLEGHALICCLTDNIKFPFLLFLLSGGHCQILEVSGIGQYRKFGETIDDALGECFDKVGKMLGLEYPAGLKIEEFAKLGDENRFNFTMPLINKSKNKEENKFNFSFSGLKTAIKIAINKINTVTEQDKNDICASFQHIVTKILVNRLENILNISDLDKGIRDIVISGGVAANQYIKNGMREVCVKYGYNLITPPTDLCTDNGVMIANVALERYKLGKISDLLITPKSKWELEEL